jgi:hypothetical protein
MPVHYQNTESCITPDHNTILLTPSYIQKLEQEIPVTHSIRKWSHEMDAKLQDCFASTDIEEFTTSVTGFISNEAG